MTAARSLVSVTCKASGWVLLLVALGNTAWAAPPGKAPVSQPIPLAITTEGSPAVPEVDPGSVFGAVTLLGGGVMVLTDRRRAR